MKKSTLAIATLLTALSAATIVPAAYADDAPATDTSKSTCAAATPACGAATPSTCSACKPADDSTGSDS